MMQPKLLKEKIARQIILMDGAMGTYFNRLHPNAGEAEYANISHPDWIREIHEKYIAAGAELIRTNTFAVNHMLFEQGEIQENLIAAVQNAKEAAADRVFVAGSVGPIRISDEREEKQVMEEYRFICDTLLAGGIRIFILETFADKELAVGIAKYLRSRVKEKDGLFILAQFSVNRMGYTQYGNPMQRLVEELENEQLIDGFGFNCGIGVTHMNKLLEELTFTKDSIVGVLPNAGYEHMLRGRQLYADHPSYYASVMKQITEKGINLIGGCCGTTPEHTQAIASMLGKSRTPKGKKLVSPVDKAVSSKKPNAFMEKLNRGERVYVVEIDSPFDGDGDKFLSAAYQLKENHIDLVTISDSPMARPRAEAFEMGIYIAGKTGVRVMPHVSCRDRNLIALRSAILGGHINGIRDMLIITGDPVARDDRSLVTGVFDVNSVKLMEYVKKMNLEIFREEPFFYGGALNYAGVNIDAIADRMKKKMAAGCSYFLTQPVYSDADMERVRELKRRTGAKIILGIMPLVSLKNAMFMKNELPGIDVPDEIICRYKAEMSRQEAEDTAEEISVEIGRKAMDFADGFYLMTPFNRVALINRIVNGLR
ncbi:MAG: bifunctional homocysteine S-methyltransferase/methylenetetrahydrofolate reductase [Bacteroidales bacterium]|nr:bifunctional homocysteine S-methyltransferase/methylenetetrahydrofolate reductase [Clostridium sp.]MCM1203247.1 bifunctional homocysteine S-methyltransferase/methylenetetrahydrofolate reductase [Bacteroidales bacterium]